MKKSKYMSGALTSKPSAFTSRSWEAAVCAGLDWFDPAGSNIALECCGPEVNRVLPRINEEVNGEWVSDKIRFGYDALKVQRIDRTYILGKEVPLKRAISVMRKVSGFWYMVSGKFLTLKDGFVFKLYNNLKKSVTARGSEVENRKSFFLPKKIKKVFCVNVNPRIDSPIFFLIMRMNCQKLYQFGAHNVWNFVYKHLGRRADILYSYMEGRHKIIKKGVLELISERYSKMVNNLRGIIWSGDPGSISRKEVNLKELKEAGKIIRIKKKELIYYSNNDEHWNGEVYSLYQGHNGDRNAKSEVVIPCGAPTERKEYSLNLWGMYQKVEKKIKRGIEQSMYLSIIIEMREKLKIEGLNSIEIGYKNVKKIKTHMRLRDKIEGSKNYEWYLTDSLTRCSPIMGLISAYKRKSNFQ
jgi:hypothetical protein